MSASRSHLDGSAQLTLRSAGQPVSRVRGVPLYRQVGAQVEELIAREAPAPGTRLPNESELAAAFGVNRLTVRQALSELAQRGLITTVHGRGSFVAEPPIRHDISGDREASLTRTMRSLGREVSQRLLGAARDDDRQAQRALGSRASLRRYDQLRFVDGIPWTLTRTWLPARRFAELERRWGGEGSLYDALEEIYGIRMRRAARTIWAEAAGPTDAEHLLIPITSPLLIMYGHNVSQDGRPVAVVEHRGRADRVQFTFDYER